MRIVSSGKVLNSSEFYEKKKKIRKIKIIFSLILIFILLCLYVYTSRLERFLISEVTVEGENIVDRGEIIDTAKMVIDGKYLWLIPRSNTFVYPKTYLKDTLLSSFPRIKILDIETESLKNLILTITEHVPFALYCTQFSNLNDFSNCYFLNDEGYIFAEAPTFSNAVYFIYTNEEITESPISKSFSSLEIFQELEEFKESLEDFGLSIVGLKSSKEEYKFFLSNGGELVWSNKSDLNLVYSNLEAFISSETVKNQEDFFEKLESIDLRTDNKVFYRLHQ